VAGRKLQRVAYMLKELRIFVPTTNRQTERQADRQAERQAERQSGRNTDRQADGQIKRPFSIKTDYPVRMTSMIKLF
jgi:hypothetical protein